MLRVEVGCHRSADLHVVADVIAAVEGGGCAALGSDLGCHEVRIMQRLSYLACDAVPAGSDRLARVADRVLF